MKVNVIDLMNPNVITLQPHQPLGEVKQKFSSKKLNSAPVVDDDFRPVGMISSGDLIGENADNRPVSSVMTKKVFTIPEYESVAIAARMMRNHKIHHLVVTKEKKVVGIISSFDLLKLVEDKKFEMKNPSTPKKRGPGGRKRAEA